MWLARGTWQQCVVGGDVLFEFQDLPNGVSRYRILDPEGFYYWSSDRNKPIAIEDMCGMGLMGS